MGTKGLAASQSLSHGFRTTFLTLAYKEEQQLCIPSVTESMGIHLYYTFSRPGSQNNFLSVFKIYLIANK